MSLEKIEAADLAAKLDVRRLRLTPGDLVVVTTPHELDIVEIRAITTVLKDFLHKGGLHETQVLVLHDGMEIAAVSTPEALRYV